MKYLPCCVVLLTQYQYRLFRKSVHDYHRLVHNFLAGDALLSTKSIVMCCQGRVSVIP